MNKLDSNLRSAASLSVFKKNLLKFTRPFPNRAFYCHNYKRIKHLAILNLGLSTNSYIVLKTPWINFACVALILKVMSSFLFTVSCLVSKDAPSWPQLSTLMVLWQILIIRYWLKFLTHISFFRYISKYPHTLNFELYHISEQIWRKSVLVFCNFLVFVHLFKSFYPNVYLEAIYSNSPSSWVCFWYLLGLFLYNTFLFIHIHVPLEYFRHLVVVLFLFYLFVYTIFI